MFRCCRSQRRFFRSDSGHSVVIMFLIVVRGDIAGGCTLLVVRMMGRDLEIPDGSWWVPSSLVTGMIEFPRGEWRADRIAGDEREAALWRAAARSGSCNIVDSSDRRDVNSGLLSTRLNIERSSLHSNSLSVDDSHSEQSSSSMALSDMSSEESSSYSVCDLRKAAFFSPPAPWRRLLSYLSSNSSSEGDEDDEPKKKNGLLFFGAGAGLLALVGLWVRATDEDERYEETTRPGENPLTTLLVLCTLEIGSGEVAILCLLSLVMFMDLDFRGISVG